MGLYFAVFRGNEELAGVEVGRYSDHAWVIELVGRRLERGDLGCRFPVFALQSDDGGYSWSLDEVGRLKDELAAIEAELAALPADEPLEGWRAQALSSRGVKPRTLAESITDIDGRPLLALMRQLCEVALGERLPILFQ